METKLVRQLGPDQWDVLRQVRLRGLRDSPDSFWATYEDEVAYRQQDWARFIVNVTWFVAGAPQAEVGVLGVIKRAEAAGEAEVIGLWVDPSARNQGHASQLLAAAKDTAAAARAERLTLWVTATNEAATHLYQRHGFTFTGETAPLARNPTLTERRMVLPVQHV